VTAHNAIEVQPRDELGRVALTKRQRQVVDAIRMMTRQHGYPPTIREIEQAFGMRSPNSVKAHLNPLRRKGWVTWNDGQARTLRLVGE